MSINELGLNYLYLADSNNSHYGIQQENKVSSNQDEIMIRKQNPS